MYLKIIGFKIVQLGKIFYFKKNMIKNFILNACMHVICYKISNKFKILINI
jgi:hypothetical protein